MDNLLQQLKEGEAIAAADTILTVPNQLGVDDNAHVIDSILTHVAPALGWRSARSAPRSGEVSRRAVARPCPRQGRALLRVSRSRTTRQLSSER